VTRENLRATFAAESIDARVFFHPLSSLSMFVDVPQNVVARSISKRAINLPSYHDMTEMDIFRVIDVIKSQVDGEYLHKSHLGDETS